VNRAEIKLYARRSRTMVADFYVSRCLRVARVRFRASVSRRASGGVRPRCDRAGV